MQRLLVHVSRCGFLLHPTCAISSSACDPITSGLKLTAGMRIEAIVQDLSDVDAKGTRREGRGACWLTRPNCSLLRYVVHTIVPYTIFYCLVNRNIAREMCCCMRHIVDHTLKPIRICDHLRGLTRSTVCAFECGCKTSWIEGIIAADDNLELS